MIQLKKHDQRIEGFFNDSSEFQLSGRMVATEDGQLALELGQDGAAEMILSLTKVSELP